jgi:hypothetical protein
MTGVSVVDNNLAPEQRKIAAREVTHLAITRLYRSFSWRANPSNVG